MGTKTAEKQMCADVHSCAGCADKHHFDKNVAPQAEPKGRDMWLVRLTVNAAQGDVIVPSWEREAGRRE